MNVEIVEVPFSLKLHWTLTSMPGEGAEYKADQMLLRHKFLETHNTHQFTDNKSYLNPLFTFLVLQICKQDECP